MSRAEAEFALQLRTVGALNAGCEREYRFHETRRWRFDFAWPAEMVAVEVEGTTKFGAIGRHQSHAGFQGDVEKYAEALLLGWRVLRVTQDDVRSGRALAWLERLLR